MVTLPRFSSPMAHHPQQSYPVAYIVSLSSRALVVSYTVFNEILNGKRPVTTEYALLLEAALGTNASIWIGLQADYNMQKAKQDKSFMKRLEKIRKIAAVF